MTIIKPSPQASINLKQHALLVLFICYSPHITTQPPWIFMMFVAAILYRLTADYFSYAQLSWWVRAIIVASCLLLLSGNIFSSGFFVRFLVAFIILKCLELNTIRDLKVLILCNFFLIFSALIVTQELWVVIYMFAAILANLTIMVKLSAPQVKLSQLGSNSGRQLLIVIPLSVLLFYVFPRIDPLWNMPSLSRVSNSLDEKMTPGSVVGLFNDESIVMQILFTKNPILRGYWREFILSFYTGESWYPSEYNASNFRPLNELRETEEPDYEVLLEPTQKKWLFYAGYPVGGVSNLIFSPDHGMMRGNKEAITKRFAYSLKVIPESYQTLSAAEYAEATQLPNHINPRLSAWAKEEYSKANNDIKTFITFLHQYIHEQAFWYTLTPPSLAAGTNQMDSFWFDTQKGFCEHYASAVTFVLRAAGIPARVVLGYYGGKWNPITNTITIQQNSAHAWLEYWQEGSGWHELDPTSFIATERIDQRIQRRDADLLDQGTYLTISDVPWRERMTMLVDSARFYSQRWFLFYNQSTQENLLQGIGLGKWNAEELLQVSLISIPIFFVLIGLYYQWWQRKSQDPLLKEYHSLQTQFKRFNIPANSSATINQQCKALTDQVPALAPILESFNDRYEQIRLMRSDGDSKETQKETISLFKKLRYRLRAEKIKRASSKEDARQ